MFYSVCITAHNIHHPSPYLVKPYDRAVWYFLNEKTNPFISFIYQNYSEWLLIFYFHSYLNYVYLGTAKFKL